MIKPRTVGGLARKGRPFSDYVTVCHMDETNGLNLGSQYSTEATNLRQSFPAILLRQKGCACGNQCPTLFVSAIGGGTTDYTAFNRLK